MSETAQQSADKDDSPVDFLITFLKKLKEHSTSEGVSVPATMTTLISQSLELVSGLNTYPVAMSSPLSDDAQFITQKTSELDFDGLQKEGKTGKFTFCKEMASHAIQGNFLKMLVRMCRAKSILEVGTFTGFAALNMAEAMSSDGRVVTLEKFPAIAEVARELLSQTKQKDKVEVQVGPAIDLMKAMVDKREQFDFVFIDAAKNEYIDYVKILLDHNLLSPGGTLVIDNTIFKGLPYMSSIPDEGSLLRVQKGGTFIHKFNEYLKNEPRVEQAMIPLCDGLTIVRRVGE